MKSYVAKAADIKNQDKWYVIDAEGLVLGRLASIVASRLRGKHKPTFTPHAPMGDNIIITNAEKIAVTGNKLQDKKYVWHTGFPGGVKQRSVGQVLSGPFASRAIVGAVRNMIAKGPLREQLLRRLHVYSGTNHPHQAQNPEALDIASMNVKNSKKGGE